MGYLYLALALAGGVAKGLLGKRLSGKMASFRDCLFINAMRLLLCMLISFLAAALGGGLSALAVSGKTLGICGISGLGMGVFCVCWMYAYRTEAYILLNIFTMLGTVITCGLDYLFYKTPITPGQGMGITMILCAVVTVSRYNREIKGKMSGKAALILVLGCVGSAVADFTQRVYMLEIGKSASVYNFYAYALGSGILLAALGVALLLRKKGITPVLLSRRYMLLYSAISACLFLNTVAKTLAAGTLSAAQIYPILQGANLIASILLGHLLFRERITGKSVAGMVCAFAGLMLIRMG